MKYVIFLIIIMAILLSGCATKQNTRIVEDAVSAGQLLPLAQKAVPADAHLTAFHSTATANFDGTDTAWVFHFYSPTEKKQYEIFIAREGEILDQKSYDVAVPQTKLDFVDSTEIAKSPALKAKCSGARTYEFRTRGGGDALPSGWMIMCQAPGKITMVFLDVAGKDVSVN